MSKIFLDPGAWTTCMSSNGETTNTLKLCTDTYNSQTMYRPVQLPNTVKHFKSECVGSGKLKKNQERND